MLSGEIVAVPDDVAAREMSDAEICLDAEKREKARDDSLVALMRLRARLDLDAPEPAQEKVAQRVSAQLVDV